MPDIRIHRPHQLGLSAARNVAHAWARKAEAKLGLACTYEEGTEQDTLHFSRAGVQGTLQVQADRFDLAAELGFLFGAFQKRIEAEIGAQLDKLLHAQTASAADTQAVSVPASKPAEVAATPAKPALKTAAATKKAATRKATGKGGAA